MTKSAVSRRDLLFGALAIGAGVLSLARVRAGTPTPRSAGGKVKIENFSASGDSQGVVEVARVVKSDEEWRAQLSPLSFEVTRHEGTERAFSGEYAANHASGLYRCICCETALFDSRTKFESGTGWPSFYQPISKLNVRESADYTLGMQPSRRLVHALRRAPRPRFRRRTATDRASLLHELRGVQFRSQGREDLMNTTTVNRFRRMQLLLCMLTFSVCAFGAERATVIPAPAVDNPKAAGPMQTAVLAGGCFWGVQGVYQHVRGVRKVLSGYAGGDKSTANTDGRHRPHRSRGVRRDPVRPEAGLVWRAAANLLSVAHDPTQLNRQGPDVGTQYRSAIFYTDDSQKKIAKAYIAQLDKAKVFERPIVTTVTADTGFYPAEDYHQDFLVNNPENPYIVFNDLPKVHNLKKLFPRVYSGSRSRFTRRTPDARRDPTDV